MLEWHVHEGEEVERGAPLAEVETEKATVELPSPVSGRVLTLHATAGERLDVGRPLVTFQVRDQPGIVGAIPRPEAGERRVRLRLRLRLREHER